jgi:hypothetical protein
MVDITAVRVRIVTIGGALVGRMTKGRGVRILDAMNLKGDFFALTDVEDERGAPDKARFIAVNKSQVITVEELEG